MSLHRIIRWQSDEDFGLEHMELRETDWGYLAQSTVIGTRSTASISAAATR
jgi:hypothetical protein